MIRTKEESISILLKNFIESQKDVELALLYSREGLLMSRYGSLKNSNGDEEIIEEVHGAITGLVENLLKKISMEYKIGHFGTGSFETQDHRIIFLEAGPEAILLCVCDYYTNLDKLFPIAYLVVEKTAQLLEESFDFKYNSLDLPDLTIHNDFSLRLDLHEINQSEPLSDGVHLKHLIKRAKEREKIFKLILLGSAAVGKTTLVNSFLGKKKVTNYRPTLGMSLSNQKYHLGSKDDMISFLIYDLAGQEFFKRVRHDYYTGANCVFVVYDITRKETFDEGVNFWFNDARDELGDIPFVLIGNKLDIEDQRQVSKEEGLKKAEELRSSFIETSALKNVNVQDTFKIIGIGLFFKSFNEAEE